MTTWVLFAGLPGTGKSTLAKALAERLDAALLDKDGIRAALFPGRLTDYSEAQDQLCMDAMLAAAAYLTEQQRSPFIFFDGRTFSTRQQREQVLQAASRAGASWRILLVECTQQEAEARLAKGDPTHPAKNRGPALYHAIRQRYEAIEQPFLAVDTTLGFTAHWEAILGYLRSASGGVR